MLILFTLMCSFSGTSCWLHTQLTLDTSQLMTYYNLLTEETHWLSWGTEILLLAFCTMLAWFLRFMWMMDGASLQGSPSTCTGIDL